MKSKIILILFLFLNITTQAQKKKDVVGELTNSPFMKELRQIRTEAIEIVKNFQNNSSPENSYTKEERTKVRLAYSRLATEYNHILETLGKHLQNKHKLRMMKDDPEGYEIMLNGYVNRLTKVYEKDFLQTVNDIEKGFGNPILIAALINFTGQLVNSLTRFSIQNKSIKAKVIQNEIIQPNLFPEWEQINYNGNDDYSNGGIDPNFPDGGGYEGEF